MLVRSREISLQRQVKELGRARTTTGRHIEMQCERADAHIQKKTKGKENKNHPYGCIKHKSTVWSPTFALCHAPHPSVTSTIPQHL